MQPGGVAQQGHGRSPSSTASPSSSSSAVSTPHLGFESMQQQQMGPRQSLQQQLLRKSEGNEALLASYHAGAFPARMGGSNFPLSSGSIQMPHLPRKFMDMSQYGPTHVQDEGQNNSQGIEQPMLNPVHHSYSQHALQATQQKASGMQPQQQANMGLVGSQPGKEPDARMGVPKVRDLISVEAAKQAQLTSSKKPFEQFVNGEKQVEQGHQQAASDQRNESKSFVPQAPYGQFMPANSVRSMQAPQAQLNIQNIPNSQLVMAQLQAMQAWALERNIDLSSPANANLVAQLIPFMQSQMASQQKLNDNNSVNAQGLAVPISRQQVASPPVLSENSPRGNSSSDVSGQSGSTKSRQTVPTGPFGSAPHSSIVSNTSSTSVQHLGVHSRENQSGQRSNVAGNGLPPLHPPQPSGNMSLPMDQSLLLKNSSSGPEALQMQYLRQSNRSSPQSTASSNDGVLLNRLHSQGGPMNQMQQQRSGFTKQQQHVLKAQILAFRRLKKGDSTLPQELLRAIAPPPLESQLQQVFPPSGTSSQDRYSSGKKVEGQTRHLDSVDKDPRASPSVDMQKKIHAKEDAFDGDERASASAVQIQGTSVVMKEPGLAVSAGKGEQVGTSFVVKSEFTSEQDAECGTPKIPAKIDLERSKAVVPTAAVCDTAQVKKPVQASNMAQPKDVGSTRKYHGPLFDFPYFTRKHDSIGSAMTINSSNNLTLAYDVKDLIFEEGLEVLQKKRSDNIHKIGGILAVNLERKRIRPDLVLRLQIEEKKLRLSNLQARMRDEIDQQQQEIMAMPDRPYRKFVRLCERQRVELVRQVQATQKAIRERQLKSVFQWRKKLLESHWAMRDARTTRNRGVAKYHERTLREFSKRTDDRNKRMEALKNNDVQRYREMLMEQQTSIPGDAGERYAVLSSFLSQTEEYLQKLGSKITAAKSQQEVDEAANTATAAARAQGLSEEEVRSVAACAREEVMIRNRFSEMNAPRDSSSANKYYTLAHAVNERVIRQPSMLRAGTLRDYQLVGLQWMLSLYNNKLNGILADEMGLGKTVQVMALIAYLMEFKGNYGPHLIIVPNAVLVNWKSEFHRWLPSVSCIFYVGGKDQRSKLFFQEVCAMKFNVLVTTYEFIMFDRSKLSKLDWKYIIIDEAQRMKDRESVLSRDLDKYRCQRRLLLTGTPLQNDLKELWSLLNLLLPEVFDNRKAFHDWFSQPFQKDGPTHNAEDDWLETEKKVIIIHRLHQILEPFMLRRRVEDVEGSLPAKVSIVLKCRMSAIQGAVYDWIKSTGTLRVDPEDEMQRVQKNPFYQAKIYKPLQNRCMELRKTCNHPLLNYPYFNDLSKEFLVRSCGKLWILDRILIKLHRTGHRVLLFSTMTKLLDILEDYLQWRRLVYRRIDGTTSLEDRESAIVDFNSPGSDCFIFLLSIRAAGRGLNLQSADTVVIYDPDSNPKNEEQAVARAHRIGQKREVKVIYMEAVVDKISSHQKEDEFRIGGTIDMEDDLAGKDRYMGSIESLIRNNIQQYKIDMADEVINAGRFDQRTTHEERRITLESLLHDEERYQETVHDVPSLQEVNRMIARSEEEVEFFDQMDEELDWPEDMVRYDQVPKWLQASSREVNATITNLSKKPSKHGLLGGNIGIQSAENNSDSSARPERRTGRTKGKKFLNYAELDDENGLFSDASSEERNGYNVNEEEGEIGEFEDEDTSGGVGAVGEAPTNINQSEDDGLVQNGLYEYTRAPEGTKNCKLEEAGSSGSSSGSQRLLLTGSPVSSQKFGSLSALDARPGCLSRRLTDELEEGEIAMSGDSHMDRQQSGSWIHDRDEGEDEQVLQPKVKRKRSIRFRPRQSLERGEEKSSNEKPSLQRVDSSHLPFQLDRQYEAQLRTDPEPQLPLEFPAFKHDQSESSLSRRTLPSRRNSSTLKHASPKSSNRFNCLSSTTEETAEQSRENWDDKIMTASWNSNFGPKMSELVQRKCKNVTNKLQRRIEKEGPQIVPLLTDLWKRTESSAYDLLDIRKIDMRMDRIEYHGVKDFVMDVQLMLKGALQFYGFSHEVRNEARKVHDLFFDIMKIAFPDSDFREARNSLSFSGPSPTSSVPSSRQVPTTGPSKRHRPPVTGGAESDLIPPVKLLPRVPNVTTSGEDRRPTRHLPHRESRLSSSNWEQAQEDDSPVLTHPGELVICKKRRKEREKAATRQRPGSTGTISPPSTSRRTRNSAPGLFPRATAPPTNPPNQGWANQPSPVSGTVGWANPVKRMRTDAGKRRPSHL